ncbi:MAG: undecaprenyl/decaprenyl-phosphate alpha-N-acetylglucosaminyl 1-phosphate transferase [Candidatus Omnitrophica bacterium]|nr:undecaprenyl/decaprenyl-phosphate alpha-N-acetylglucosaminyl 1-phosphate transferase [Candidatus Omnitrophota bacterium]
MNELRVFFLLVVPAGVLSGVLTFFIRAIALRLRIFDIPSPRKIHTRPVPTTGGLAIAAGFWLALAGGYPFVPAAWRLPPPLAVGLGAASILVVILGIGDDLFDWGAWFKLFAQAGIAAILVFSGFQINLISLPFGGSMAVGIAGIFLTMLWIVGMMNAINLLDGLDGLAAGVSAIALLFLFCADVRTGMMPAAVLSITLTGALLGFLVWNFHPAKIFMGNTGSMFLGMIMAVVAIVGAQKSTAVFTLFVPVLAMAIPILDTSLSIVRRLSTGRPVFKADGDHMHHRLLKVHQSQRHVVISLYFITCCYGLIAASFTGMKGVFGWLALVVVTLVTFRWLRNWGFLDFKK